MNTAAWVVLCVWIFVGLALAALSTRRSISATVSIPEKSAMPVGCAAQRGQREVAGVGSVVHSPVAATVCAQSPKSRGSRPSTR